MAFTHGSNAVLVVNSGALTTFMNDVSFNRTADTAETSTFGVTSKTYIPGLKDGTLSVSGLYDKTTTTGPVFILEAIYLANAAVTCVWNPAGTTTGNYAYTFSAILTSLDISSGIGDAVQVSAEFQATGTITPSVL